MDQLALVTLNPPSLDFTVDGSGLYATKAWLALDAAAMRFGGLPDDAEITASYICSEQMADYPAGCYGDVTWAVVPPLYTRLSGIPEQERCQPIGPHLLGRLRFVPGADPLDWREHGAAIPVRPGDRIGIFPQIGGAPNRFLALFTGLRMRSATGFTELPGIVYHDLPNKQTTGADAYSYRCTLSDIPEGGTEVRVTSLALSAGCNILHQSIGVRNGTSGFNMKAAPVQLSYDGSAAINIAGLAYKRSAWAPLVTAPGDALLVHSCVSGAWSFKDCAISDGNPGCYVAGTSGYDQQNFSGTVQVVGNGTQHRKHVVAMVEVR